MAEFPTPARASLWFRLLLPQGALGPGKIALMQAIEASGSVSAAAKTLRMSHARSVKFVAEINALASARLIETRVSGQSGGGAILTSLGRSVIDAYAEIEDEAERSISPALNRLTEMLSAPPQNDDSP